MKVEQLRNRILAADLAWIPAALAAEQSLCSGLHCSQLPLNPSNFTVYVVCTVVAWILLSENLHLDGFRGGWRLSALLSHLLLAIALLMVLLLAVENVSERYLGRVTLSVFSLFLLIGFLIIRGLTLRTVLRKYQTGNVHRVVILGSDRLAGELAVKFSNHPELLCKVIGFLCPGGEIPSPRPIRGAVAGPATVSTMDVITLLRQHDVDELVMAHTPVSTEILNLVALCRQQAIRVSLVPQPYELYLSCPRLLDLGGLPLLQLGETAPVSARIGKRVLDIGLGTVLAAASAPVVLVCAALLRISTGSAFRWERRIGWRGVRFSMLRLNVERDTQTSSRFERMLWQLSISELPQFWNVIRGDMSLVGPRPEGPERAHCYSAWQEQRLSVKPGMTGLAQVRGLREQHPSEDKTRHDLQYMLQPSVLKDLSLLIETIWTLTARLVRLHRPLLAGNIPEGEVPPSILYSPNTQPFPEILQHAHRTQSGSD
ncbi:MAG: exopolysaccharide biosynthesis polyprenyl glycosylphosphotransferase [Candidatus Sulfotelmatobacter sp.]|nr:exopolysaccharide biosynthesis polyprenyl glycosylphosphotransferase [Candidatus Sulfotelmatobacter sp.]